MYPYTVPFLLDADNHPVPCNDAQAVGELLADLARRRLAYDVIESPRGTLTLSTVFLCLSHGDDDHGRPLLYETRITGTLPDGQPAAEGSAWTVRKATRDQILAYHRSMVAGFRYELAKDAAQRTAYEHLTSGDE